MRESGVKTLPLTGVILISGSDVLKIPFTISSSPLNTDRMVISASVPTVTPATEIAEITLMAFRDFLANRYLLAMYSDSFICFFRQQPVALFLCCAWCSGQYSSA